MKKVVLSGLFLLILGALNLVFAKPATRLVFKKGATTATASDWLKSRTAKAVYVLRVRRGQNIEVRPTGGTISIRTTILNPSGGDDRSDHDMQGNSGYENTVVGDYKIIVSASRKDDRQSGRFTIRVSIK